MQTILPILQTKLAGILTVFCNGAASIVSGSEPNWAVRYGGRLHQANPSFGDAPGCMG